MSIGIHSVIADTIHPHPEHVSHDSAFVYISQTIPGLHHKTLALTIIDIECKPFYCAPNPKSHIRNL